MSKLIDIDPKLLRGTPSIEHKDHKPHKWSAEEVNNGRILYVCDRCKISSYSKLESYCETVSQGAKLRIIRYLKKQKHEKHPFNSNFGKKEYMSKRTIS